MTPGRLVREIVVPRVYKLLLTVLAYQTILCGPRMSRPSVPRMFFRKKTSGGRAISRLSRTVARTVCGQQVIATLGRLEDLRESGQLERLLRSGARFATRPSSWAPSPMARRRRARRDGSARPGVRALVEETSCRAVVESLAGSRRHDFPLERAVFLSVLHRLFSGGSDRAAERWRQDYRIEGVEASTCITSIAPWLARRRTRRTPAGGATPFAPRC